ncbi:PLP-dependent aminotransferase family protein [Leisingera thetidis]|uniref:aminotransferase-like domain-containing protein n=1 Tax=Leisingera thetidis TaxID=2930199 RepID=UPI0021F7E8C3|nr:PLP-dependent aminotransferase family protein [Leisingera thetidis]
MRYTDLAALVAERIRSGALPPGTRLPAHRRFAEEHGVALATATRAYGELKRQGLILGEAGRGMFVRDPALPLTLGLEQAGQDGLIDLVFNMPGSQSDAERLRAGLKRLAASGDLEAMLRYQPHGGRPHERRIVAGYLAQRHETASPEHLFLTCGAQHGLAVAVLGLLQPGDGVATGGLTYPGFKQVAALHRLSLAAVPGDAGGMDPGALERLCRDKQLKAVYLMPTVHNPLGTVMDEAARRDIAAVARRHGLIIIEDSAYGFLEPDPPPGFLDLAPERTVHVGGFSKNIATGLRIGFIAVPGDCCAAVSRVIRATTWNTPALVSALVTHWIEDGTVQELEAERRLAGARGQALCREILRGVPMRSHPNASFAWLPLSGGARAEPVIARLSGEGVAVSSAAPYAVGDAAPQALRIAFGGVTEQELRFGLERIRDALAAPAG